VRRILFEIQNAPVLAWIAAALAVIFALYHALRRPRQDEKGNREPFPVGAVVGGLVAAAVLVWGVALNDAFREDVVTRKDGSVVRGRILGESADPAAGLPAPPERKNVRLDVAVAGRAKPVSILLTDVVSVRTRVPMGIPIYSYGFMMMAAFATAIYVAAVRARNAGLDPNLILDAGLWCMISGIVGARLFYAVQFHDQFRGRPFFDYFKVWEGGLVFYGGLLAAMAVGIAFLVRKKAPVLRLVDVIAPSVPLGIAFARFGCFLNGCCFGRRVDPSYPLAVRFGEGSHALLRHHQLEYVTEGPLSAPVHPSQLYESTTCFALFLLLSLYYVLTRRRRVDGEVLVLFAVLYPVTRIFNETFREDTDPVFGTGLTIGQVVSLAILAASVPLFVWAWVVRVRRARRERAGKPGEPGAPAAASPGA
jgi:phosphatidylglycerol:prolipoprotein diacylglycerol transferase